MGEVGLRSGLQVNAGDEGGSKGLVGLKDCEGQTYMGMDGGGAGSVSQSTW